MFLIKIVLCDFFFYFMLLFLTTDFCLIVNQLQDFK